MPTTAKIEFIQFHQPVMESGLYRVQVDQTIQSRSGSVPLTTYSSAVTFAVTGERFSYLTSQDVFAVFPPPGSLGDHSNVVPHITLNRSTLPWERSPDGESRTLPWLALILLRDSDFQSALDRPIASVISLQDLLATSPSTAKYPHLALEPGQDPADQVRVIDVKWSVLQRVVPRKSDLACLAHVRQPKDGGGQAAGGELATVLCNRLPGKGEMSTAYLVSMEGRYPAGGDTFDSQGAGPGDLVRLVYLQSFRFSCIDDKQSFTQLLIGLDRTPATVRLPDSASSAANGYLSMGYTPLPHTLREGDRTVSWYHGPFAPGEPTDTLNLPVRAADELLRYDSATGMLDVSYAAAWQLGRTLTLQNKGLCTALYNWKRSRVQSLKQAEQEVEHLPIDGQQQSQDIPAAVVSWFLQLSLLEGIPFNYLLPDERLLPVESIRFFRADGRWVECLLDGAFSIGRVTSGNLTQDAVNPATAPYAKLSGFLLRSSVVPGWPGLIVDGYGEVINDENFDPPQAQSLKMIRMERLSPNVLLCLFADEVKTVDIHLAPETMHFGVDAPIGGPPPVFHKTLRDLDSGAEIANPIPVPWIDESAGTIDIAGLAGAMTSALSDGQAFTSAQFALEMLEGVQKVRFVKQGS